MSSKFLQVFVSNARFDNTELLKAIAGGPTPAQVLDFCQNYRIWGIGLFLLYGETEKLHLCLYKSGRAWLSFLENAREEQLVTSRSAPFFDALAALDVEGAHEIARRSRHSWCQGMEYKEDFLYMHFLMSHFFLGASREQGLELLREYEEALQGSEDLRLDLCRAFLDGSSESFDASLSQYLTAQRQRHDRLLQREKISREWWATAGQVSVEGLGLLTLAEQTGFSLRREYPGVPSLARARSKPSHPADSWRDLDV